MVDDDFCRCLHIVPGIVIETIADFPYVAVFDEDLIKSKREHYMTLRQGKYCLHRGESTRPTQLCFPSPQDPLSWRTRLSVATGFAIPLSCFMHLRYPGLAGLADVLFEGDVSPLVDDVDRGAGNCVRRAVLLEGQPVAVHEAQVHTRQFELVVDALEYLGKRCYANTETRD